MIFSRKWKTDETLSLDKEIRRECSDTKDNLVSEDNAPMQSKICSLSNVVVA